MKKAALIVVAIGLLTAGLSAYTQSWFFGLGNSSRVDSAPIVVGQGSSFEQPDRPHRLIIPAIGVDANVQKVGLAWQGTGDMGIPTNFTDVGWYKDGPAPGAPGSAVIDGHLDGKDVPEAVFYNLDKLKKGDEVSVVDATGKTFTFRVVETKVYDYNAPADDVFDTDKSKTRLNLITCAGSWDKTARLYDKRVVVFTELVT